MPALILVMLGGAFGSGARFLTGKLTLAWFGPNYPWGTLAVNLIGGFLMGVFVGTLARLGQGGEQWRLLIAVGVLGGYTTFSAFTLDLMNMIQRGDYGMGLAYVLASVVGSAVALFAGLSILRALP
ncbi:MAG: fluoride efflux transporter CrcB [Sphingomonas sp.]|uniref:fluoride efflux transporter CrcB n=1 Tax=unclassified Sphingomonas TaxID=196159 RepID=UPI0024544896|nr:MULTISPECIES: fluoride efflux transporter CrcB [unclassified Sphingomonas]MBQ1500198.1 fluoride efflux transporter CrcB [Sphingomonas sp.]MDH4744063.1 fluoride efflux transporter CrcB [Sphingomonas sp. CBMAI 2297]